MTTYRPYVALFDSGHKESLLAPIANLVKEARSTGITVWALDDYSAAHAVVVGSMSSCAIINGDALPVRTIILNFQQIENLSRDCDVSFALCLELVFLHEWGHIDLLDKGGVDAARSEFDAWDFVAPRTSATREDYENLRGHCMWHKNPQLARPIDTTPQFWQDFLRMGTQIGYAIAWGGVQAHIRRQDLKPWDVLTILQQDCKLPFDIAYDLSQEENVEFALLRLAALRRDYVELDRLVKPKPAVRHIPEQPMPGDVIPPRSLRR